MATKTTVQGGRRNRQAPAAPAKMINVASLYQSKTTEKPAPWTDPTKTRLLTWTRQKAINAGMKGQFKLVGIEPTTRDGKKSTAKLNTLWKIANAETRWEVDPDIVYIANAPITSFVESFPDKYTGNFDAEEQVPIWIAGHPEDIIDNLVRHELLPADASQRQYDNWINSVAITFDNHKANPDYQALVQDEEQQEKEKVTYAVADVARLNQLFWLSKQIGSGNKGGPIRLFDVNGADIGGYGEKLSKSPINIFTDWIVKQLENGTEFGQQAKNAIDISQLTSDLGSNVRKKAYPQVDVQANQYGTVQSRPLMVNISVTVRGEDGKSTTYDLPSGSIWTSRPEGVSVLFAEMDAVNSAKNNAVTYVYSADVNVVRDQVVGQLKTVKKRDGSAPEKTHKQKAYDPSLIYSSK